MRPTWNEYFMAIAKIVSTRSTCNSRPIGCVLVKDKQILSTGYNGAVPGEAHCIDGGEDGQPGFCFRRNRGVPEHEKQQYCVSSHAEKNAIALAARHGVPVAGAGAYVTVAPCFDCMKLLKVAGITHVYYEIPYESSNKDRDLFWESQANRYFEKFEQVTVSEKTIQAIIGSLQHPTSTRRLKEPNAV